MKRYIRDASTIKCAVGLLIDKYGRDYIVLIAQALREVFQTEMENKEIELYLTNKNL